MREGILNKNVLIGDHGEFAGICLGSDFTAEHENGIQPLRDLFGIRRTIVQKRLLGIISKESPVFGIEARRVRKDSSVLTKMSGFCILHTADVTKKYLETLCDYAKSKIGMGEKFVSFWDEYSFAIVGDEHKLTDIKSSLAAGNAAIYIGNRSFSNGGLCLAIVDRLNSATLNGLRNADENAYKVGIEAEKSGVLDMLQKAKVEYHALSPAIRDGKLLFWYNPIDQNHKAGWYEPDAFAQMLKGTGPIIKKSKDEEPIKKVAGSGEHRKKTQ